MSVMDRKSNLKYIMVSCDRRAVPIKIPKHCKTLEHTYIAYLLGRLV